MNYSFEEKRTPWKLILIIGAILAIIISLVWLYLQKNKNEYAQSFSTLLREKKYRAAAELYRKVQSYATDPAVSAEKKEEYRLYQIQYEQAVNQEVEKIGQRLRVGDQLSEDDRNLISQLEEISAASIVPLLNRETEKWLDGEIDHGRWSHLVRSFEPFSNVKVGVQTLLQQEKSLIYAQTKFSEALQVEQTDNWELAWKTWQTIIDDSEAGRFAQNYAKLHLKTYQEQQYVNLLKEAQTHIDAKRYYSGKLLLDRVFDVFPDRKEVSEKLALCNENLPRYIDPWTDPVEHLSVKPLIVDKAKAFSGVYRNYALNGMITIDEFKNLLEQLYQRDYVLISGEGFMYYPSQYPYILVPRGKKPLVLILDQYEYSETNKRVGVPVQLAYRQADDQFVSPEEANRPETARDGVDAISILDQFVQEHPDFSFNGAKARIALTIEENILGYMINERQLKAVEEKSEMMGLPKPLLSYKNQNEQERFYSLQLKDLRNLIEALKRHGYFFTNGSYSGEDMGLMETDAVLREVTLWNELMTPLLGKVRSLSFPNGSHVYQNPDALSGLIEQDLAVFYGIGPKIYNFYAETYIHIDRTPINGFTFDHAEAWGLERFLDVAAVRDSERPNE